jgi:parallel beta-helix repeat protein
MKPHVHAALVLAMLCLPGPLIAGTTRNVPSGPYPTIQSAITACVDGDTVLVADGTYTGFGNKNLSFLGKAITVKSQNGPGVTIIDCELDGRGFHFFTGETSKSVVDGFTITNGLRVVFGGGIYCHNSSPTIMNCVVSGNRSYDGGGILCRDSSPTIVNCIITGNEATNLGGGIHCRDSSSPNILNCMIAGNTADLYGGGIACIDNSSPTITSCTIAANTASVNGGGISCNGSPTITDSILWGNTPDEISVSSGTPTVEYCDVQGGTGEAWFGVGCIDDDPLFVIGPLHDYYLSQISAGQAADSPCVDAGSDTAANLGLDARTTRTDHVGDSATVDMGYHSPSCLAAMPGDVDGNGVVDGLDLSAVMTAWQTQPADALWNPSADLDCNGVVDGLDLTAVISNWTTAAAAAPASEPGPHASQGAKPGRSGAAPGNVRRRSGNLRQK